jgi:hypothetical protein
LDIEAVIERVAGDPESHLGRQSLRALFAYLSGYSDSLSAYGVDSPHDPIDEGLFFAWVRSRITMTDEHASRLNAWSCVSPASVAELMSSTDQEAFTTYLELRRQASAECAAPALAAQACQPAVPSTANPLLASLAPILERPHMYFGSDSSTHEVYAYCKGFLAAEHDLGIGPTESERLMRGFQDWLDQRYPFAKGRPWGHTFHFLKLSHAPSAVAAFAEHLEMYSAGEHPHATDRTQQLLIQNILKHAAALKVPDEAVDDV